MIITTVIGLLFTIGLIIIVISDWANSSNVDIRGIFRSKQTGKGHRDIPMQGKEVWI